MRGDLLSLAACTKQRRVVKGFHFLFDSCLFQRTCFDIFKGKLLLRQRKMVLTIKSIFECGRYFSNVELTWIIKDVNLAVCSDSTLIHSPPIVISEPIETRWGFSLRISKDKIVIYLEMLQTNPSSIRVNWASYILDRSSEESFINERYHSFKPNCKLPVQMLDLGRVLQMLCKSSINDLTLRCHMLILYDLNPVFLKAKEAGVVSLCNDLSTLPRDYLHHDVIAKVRNDEFSLNKAMLSRRGENIFQLVKDYLPKREVNLPLSVSKAAEAVFTYLYTGDLSWILSRPSLSIYDYIKRLGINELNNVYPEHKIGIESKIDAVEHSLLWIISDFKSVQNTLLGPYFVQEQNGTVSRWQLSLYTKKSTNFSGQEDEAVYIEATLVESERLLNVCIDSSVVKDGKIVHSRKIQGSVKAGGNLEVMLFEKDWIEKEGFLVSGALLLNFTVRIATGDIFTLVTENCPPPPMPLNIEKSCMALSKMMELLMKLRDFSDFSFEVEDSVFKTHKFLIAARSPIFRELLRRRENSESLRFQGFKKDIFSVFMSYMYTGIIIENDVSKLMVLYDMGNMYKIYSLKRVCASTLFKALCKENVMQIFLWADERKENKIKAAAWDLLEYLGDCIKDNPYLQIFKTKKPWSHDESEDC